MRAEPFYVAGSSRTCTRVIREATGSTVCKTGAEGVFCAVLPDDRLGLALKVRDGARRAADAAVVHLLAELGRLPTSGHDVLFNRTGAEVGRIQVA